MCRGALQHFDTLDDRGRNRQVERVMTGVEIAQTYAVEHDQHLVERTAMHTDVRLRAVRTTCAHIHTRQIL